MTHDRAGPVVIGAGATVALAADLVYAVSHWNGSFPHAFLAALLALAVAALIGFGLRFIRPIRGSRRSVRWTQRALNIVVTAVLLILIDITRGAGGNFAGTVLGGVAGLTGGFALYTGIWLMLKT